MKNKKPLTHRQMYRKAMEHIASRIECFPIEKVESYDSVKALAKKFGMTLREVAIDINKAYIKSWQPPRYPRDYHLNLLEDFD